MAVHSASLKTWVRRPRWLAVTVPALAHLIALAWLAYLEDLRKPDEPPDGPATPLARRFRELDPETRRQLVERAE